MAMTKEERAAYMRKWHAEHREQINANRRYNYAHNPEIKEKEKAWHKAWREKHKNDPEYKAKMRENTKRWRENNREYWNAYVRDYKLRKAESESD